MICNLKFRRGLSKGVAMLALGLGLLTRAAMGAPQPGASASSAFWDALQHDEVDRVQTLLLRGVDTNVVHPELGPAIVVAARDKSWKTVRLLARLSGTLVDAPNRRGETALMFAAFHGQLDVARLLVQHGAEINRAGWTPLHYAATNGHADLVRYLLDENAYIDAQSPNHTTPLMMAARHGHPEVVRLLVKAGADPTARNETGMDAAAYLQRQGQPELAEWVRERAADYARRYGTLERPRTVEMIEEEKRRAESGGAPRLPGMRD